MRKFFTTILTFLVVLTAFSACGKVKYNAVIIDEGITYKTEWLKNNMTYGVYYENPDYDPENGQGEEVLIDTVSPKSRTYIVKEQSALDEIFEEFPEIDFEKEMIIVYCFTTINNRDRILERVELDENKVLHIEFNMKKNNGRGDTSMPGREVLVVKTDRLEITQAKITYNGQ